MSFWGLIKNIPTVRKNAQESEIKTFDITWWKLIMFGGNFTLLFVEKMGPLWGLGLHIKKTSDKDFMKIKFL